MIDPAIIDALVASGCSAEQLAAAMKADAAIEMAKAEAKKAKGRARFKRWKETLNISSSEWVALKATVLQRDNFTCVYCGAHGTELSPLHVDHVIPLSRGGTNCLDNLAAACRECNSSKKDMTPEEWLA